jgi:hypothetical protein
MDRNYQHTNRIAGFYEGLVEAHRSMLKEFLDSESVLEMYTKEALAFVSDFDDEAGDLGDDRNFDELPVFERLLAVLVSQAIELGASAIGISPTSAGVCIYLELADRCDVVDAITRRGFEGLARWIDRESTDDRLSITSEKQDVTLVIGREESKFGPRIVLRLPA